MERRLNNTLHFEINVTDACNLNCVYCSELMVKRKSQYITTEAVNAYIAYIKSVIDKYDIISVNYFGGEPLLNMPVIEKVTEQLAEYDNIRFNVITNGTLLKKNSEFFNKYKDRFFIQVSYDGNPNHDKNRCNTSFIVKDNIRFGLANDYNIALHSVICPEDFKNLYSSYLDLCSLKVPGEINYVVEFAHSYHDVDEKLKNRWINDLKYNLKLILMCELIDSPKMLWFKMYNRDAKAIRAYCSAGIDNFSLSYNGDIYKCHGAVYSDDDAHRICSIFDDKLDEKLMETSKLHSCNKTMCEECQKCKSLICYNCHTSNYARNVDLVDKDYFTRWNSQNDPYICEIYRTISNYILAYDKLKTDKIGVK